MTAVQVLPYSHTSKTHDAEHSGHYRAGSVPNSFLAAEQPTAAPVIVEDGPDLSFPVRRLGASLRLATRSNAA